MICLSLLPVSNSSTGLFSTRGQGVAQPTDDVARIHVLVVDDENLIADSVAAILNRNGYDAVARYNGAGAIQYLEQCQPDIVVTDVFLPDLDGVHVAMSARSLSPDVRVVLFSGNIANVNMQDVTSVRGRPIEMLSKPVHPAELLKALRAG